MRSGRRSCLTRLSVGTSGGAAPSTTPSDIAGSVDTLNSKNNLVGTGGSGGLADGSNGNEVGVTNPGLGAIGDNGGPTQTIPLLAGSPAIDAGNNSDALDATGQPLATDQRGSGFPRIQGRSVDIGSFESKPKPPPTPTTINWPTPADMFYGTALDSTQLDAIAFVTVDGGTVIVPGTFAYSPPADTLLRPGNDQTLSVTFTPTDSTDYTGATATVSINVDRATPELSVYPVNLTYGPPLANGQLIGSATWTVGGNVLTVPGSWSYTTSAGTVLDVGNDQSESVTFTPIDSVDYTSATAVAIVNVSRAIPQVSIDPVYLTYGKPLADSQLNGTATLTVGDTVVVVPGSWSYTGVSGRVLSASVDVPEPVTFTPDDSTHYSTVATTVALYVSPAPLLITADNQTKPYGSVFSFAGTEFTTTGLIAGDVVTRVALRSAGAAATADASGSPYPITVSAALGSGLGNYSISYGTGRFTVNRAGLTITANDATAVVGQSNPKFSARYAGFVLGQGPNVLNGTLTFGTPRTPTSPVGQYPIIPGGLVSSNYAINFIDGTLTVPRPPAMPPVEVKGPKWQPFKLGRRKTAEELIVTFSGSLNSDDAGNLQNYTLDAPKKIKHRGAVYSRPVPLKSASYSPATNTVTLSLRGNLPKGPLQLTINAARLLDSDGQELDGNGDGQPGGNYIAIFSGAGVIRTARAMAKRSE